MQFRSVTCLLLQLTTVVFLLTRQEVLAQPPASEQDLQTKIGGRDVATVLKGLGAKMEQGTSRRQLNNYARHFDLVDKNRDERHSKTEFIDNGNYLTPQARRGIFAAADSDGDGFVSKSEYILNRIITDEAKLIVQAMDDDKDGAVQRAEFIKNSMKDGKLAQQVFAEFDADENGEIYVPEYLRVWGRWARTGHSSPQQRISARESELQKLESAGVRDARSK